MYIVQFSWFSTLCKLNTPSVLNGKCMMEQRNAHIIQLFLLIVNVVLSDHLKKGNTRGQNIPVIHHHFKNMMQ